jgi:hypothetical protein
MTSRSCLLLLAVCLLTESGVSGFQFLEVRGAFRMKTTLAPSTRRDATISNHGSDGTTSPTTVSRDSVAGSTVSPFSATYSQIEKEMTTATSEAKKASEAKQRGLLLAQLEQNRRLKEKLHNDSQSIPSFQHAKEEDHVTMLGSHPIEPRQSATIDLGPESRLPIEIKVLDRQAVIALARQQPKSREEDLKFQERYAGMSLEDLAFAILYDLGMVEKNMDPNDPNYQLMLQESYGAMSLQDRAFAILSDLGMVEKN